MVPSSCASDSPQLNVKNKLEKECNKISIWVYKYEDVINRVDEWVAKCGQPLNFENKWDK